MSDKQQAVEIESIDGEEKKKQLQLEVEQLRADVEERRHVIDRENAEAKKKMEFLESVLKDKVEDLEAEKILHRTLSEKERRTREELQDAKNEIINGLQGRPIRNASIGVRRLGDLDHKPIVSAAKKKYPAGEAGEKAMAFTSHLEAKIYHSDWFPFKVITVRADSKIVINEEDDFMKIIKNEWGDEVYDTVATALTELIEYNQSGRYPVPELWNFREGRRGTLGESVEFILRLWKTNKRKRT